jgi:NADPH2:quinone reductase
MKALVCKESGEVDQLVLEKNWPDPQAEDDKVLIDVKAAGLNFPDLLMVQGKYQTQPDLPFVVGGECAGVISAIGKNVSHYKVGDKVIAIGGTAFAEKNLVSENACYLMPESLNFEQAAGASITYFTSYYALKQRANLQAGETLLVLGAGGGVGIAAVEIGKMMGAKVIAAAGNEEKLQLARDMGADETINYSEQSIKDSVKELTGGKGADVVYDPVGGDYSEQALRATAWNGRFLVIGFASGPIPKIPLNLPLLKGCSVIGVFWGTSTLMEPETHKQNVAELRQLFDEGKLNPVVTDRFELEEYEKAFACLSERRARGKVIIKVAD